MARRFFLIGMVCYVVILFVNLKLTGSTYHHEMHRSNTKSVAMETAPVGDLARMS